MTFAVRTIFKPEYTEKNGKKILKQACLSLDKMGQGLSVVKKAEEKSATLSIGIQFVEKVREKKINEMTILAEISGQLTLNEKRFPVFEMAEEAEHQYLQDGIEEDQITKGIMLSFDEKIFPVLKFAEGQQSILLEFPQAPNNALYAELKCLVTIDGKQEDADTVGDRLDIGLFPAPLELGNINITLTDDKSQDKLTNIPYILSSEEAPTLEGVTDAYGKIQHKKVKVAEYQLSYDLNSLCYEASTEDDKQEAQASP